MIGSKDKFRSWIPHGFDYYSPEQTEKVLSISQRIRDAFLSSGYQEIRLPTFDYARTFRMTSRNPVITEIFETRDSDGDQLGVRSDLTVQVVKGAANGHFGRGTPLRLSYIQPVFHDIPWGSGKRREILQAGVELIGDSREERFQEVLSLAGSTLDSLGVKAEILYGDARFLDSIFSTVPDFIRSDIADAFHIKDTTRIASLCRSAGLDGKTSDILSSVPVTFGGEEALDELEKLCSNRPDLLEILRYARKFKGLVYDFSMVRELTYYTGPVIEGYLHGFKEKALSGGVYDTLYGHFSPGDQNACGFALNVPLLVDAVGN